MVEKTVFPKKVLFPKHHKKQFAKKTLANYAGNQKNTNITIRAGKTPPGYVYCWSNRLCMVLFWGLVLLLSKQIWVLQECAGNVNAEKLKEGLPTQWEMT